MNTQQLKELAESLNGEEWSYRRTTPYSRGYIIGKGGRTIVQTCDGEVPANVCRFIEGFNPASALMLIERLESAERERDELRAEQAEHDEQIARMEGKFSLAKRALDSKTERCDKAEAEIARRDADAGKPDYWQFESVNGDWIGIGESGMRQAVSEGVEVRPLYTTAPPAVLSQAIGEVRLGDFRDDGTRHAMVVCLHDQADWENFADGTKLYLRQ